MSAEVAPPPAVTVTDTAPKSSEDPFAAQREGDNPFTEEQKLAGVAGSDAMAPPANAALSAEDKAARRTSKEWDASKVKPSQFQKRKGSVYATPSSRGQPNDKHSDARYHEAVRQHEAKRLFNFRIPNWFSKKEAAKEEAK